MGDPITGTEREFGAAASSGDGADHRGNEDHHLEVAVGALSVKLTQEEIAYPEEPYVPHPIVISKDDRLQMIARLALGKDPQNRRRSSSRTPSYMGSVALCCEENYPSPAESVQFA
jgi:hypothetical protein